MALRRGKTRRVNIIVAARRRYVFDLRCSGASYQQIYEAISTDPTWHNQLPKWYSTRKVADDVIDELEHVRPQKEVVETVRQIELRRLDSLMLSLWPKATAGDPVVIGRVLDIMARRARYLPGLEAPTQYDINWDSLSEAQLARLAAGESPQAVLDTPQAAPPD